MIASDTNISLSDNHTTQAFNQLIGEVYDCAADNTLWQKMVDKLADQLSLRIEAIAVYDLQNGDFRLLELNKFDSLAPIQQALAQLDKLASSTDSNHKIYTDDLGQHIRLCYRDQQWLALALISGAQNSQRSASLALYKQLLPHFLTALKISRRFHQLRSTGAALAELLDYLPMAALVLNEHGDLLHGNGLGQTLYRERLQNQDKKTSNRNSLSNPMTNNWLKQQLGKGFLLSQLSEQSPGKQYLLIASQDQQAAKFNPELMNALFDLTNAETELCNYLIQGYNLQATAKSLNRSTHTLKTHLKNIYKKTGCRRRNELAPLLFMSPAWWVRDQQTTPDLEDS